MNNPNQRVVLVTGGSKGIGKAISRSLIHNGDRVVINYNSSSKEAEDLRDELSGINGDVSIFQADVSDYAQVKQMVDNVAETYGKIDVLVNNAGIISDCFIMLMSDKDWNNVINVNLTGVFNCSKAVSGYMIEQRSGVIINVASLSGITGLPGQTNYSAAKGGVISFTKALSKELAPFTVRVNAVAPGVIETDIVDSTSSKEKNKFLENIPLKRFGKPEEVASVVKFLASPDAGYITGEVVCVTGGLP
ncbi:MAG: 3-oxoacyl-[acyl-carrier-protein] reductase [Planctomycetes bacterium]|nr:3-oxoacyl-[acyl-carrier-protein] reductase [Planctomycetota bacterium]